MRRNFLSRFSIWFLISSRCHKFSINNDIQKMKRHEEEVKSRQTIYVSESIPMSHEQFITHFMREKCVFFIFLFERYNESLNMHMDDVNKIYCHSALIEISLKTLVCCVRENLRWIYRCVKVSYEFCNFTIVHTRGVYAKQNERALLWMNFSSHEALAVTDCLLCLRHKKRRLVCMAKSIPRSSLCHLLTFTLNE